MSRRMEIAFRSNRRFFRTESVMMKSLCRLAILSLVALLFPAPNITPQANAEMMTFGVGPNNITVGGVTVHNPATPSSTPNEATVAGSYNGFVTGGSAVYDNHNIAIYCIDATHNVYWGQQYAVTPTLLLGYQLHGVPSSDTGANDRIASIFEATYGDPASPFNAHLSDPDWQGGLQMAIWSAEYSGSFQHISATNTIVTGPSQAVIDANLILDAAALVAPPNHLYAQAYTHLVVFAADPIGVQDMITWVPGAVTNLTAVPEPTSFALLGLGGIGLAFGAIRRRRQAVAAV